MHGGQHFRCRQYLRTIGGNAVNAVNRIHQLAYRGVLTLLLATVLIVPLLFSPNLAAWRAVKPITFELLVLGLVALALAQSTVPGCKARLLEFLRIGPNQPILMLVVYGAVSWYRSPSSSFSGAEWMRLACGVGLYFVVTTTLRRREQVRRIVDVLIAIAILTSLFGIVTYGQTNDSSMASSFGNGQLFSGFLLLLLPLLVVLAFDEAEPIRKIAAQTALILTAPALVLAQTRSSWIGALVALAVLGYLSYSSMPPGSLARHRHRIVAPVVIVVGALGLFLVASQTLPMVRARAATLGNATRDPSLGWRVEMWKGAWQLIRERPLFGWGIGTFPLEQTRTVPFAKPLESVLHAGPTLQEEAHNEYLQTAAEMGLLGLGLYLWILGAFFVYGIRALRRNERGLRYLVLMGCLAAIAGQAVDALSNPAWRFADVSFLFWLVMGLGMTSARYPHRAPGEERTGAAAPLPAVRWSWQGAALALLVFALGGAATAVTQTTTTPVPQYCPKDPIAAIETIEGSGQQIHLNAGQCIVLDLTVKYTGTNTYVDVTNDPNTTFFTNPTQGQFTSKNVWCALNSDKNKEFPIYGQYCNPCDNVCVRATVHVHVNR
jgi:O-antigen ligase